MHYEQLQFTIQMSTEKPHSAETETTTFTDSVFVTVSGRQPERLQGQIT